MFFGHSLCWYEKVCCLEHLGILHRARMKICIFEPFPAYGKVAVNQKIFSRYDLFLKTKFACFTSFKDQFNPRKWKKNRLKRKTLKRRTRQYAQFLLFLTAKIWPLGAEVIFLPKNFILKYFQKLMRFQFTFGLRYIHGQSLTEIDSPTRNAVDRF